MENNQKIPRILSRVTAALAGTGGLEAIVLGGSHAAGNAREGSDLDIGLYYRGTLDVSLLNRKAAALDDRGQEGLVTQVGEWGPSVPRPGQSRPRGGRMPQRGCHPPLPVRPSLRLCQRHLPGRAAAVPHSVGKIRRCHRLEAGNRRVLSPIPPGGGGKVPLGSRIFPFLRPFHSAFSFASAFWATSFAT